MYAQHARDHNVIIYTEDRGRASERAKKVAREASYWLFGGYVIALPTLYERLGLHGVSFGIPNAQANQMNCVSSLRMPKQLESPLTDFVQQICLDVCCLSDMSSFLTFCSLEINAIFLSRIISIARNPFSLNLRFVQHYDPYGKIGSVIVFYGLIFIFDKTVGTRYAECALVW